MVTRVVKRYGWNGDLCLVAEVSAGRGPELVMKQIDPASEHEARRVLPRRERQRQATLEEIIAVGRSLLRAGHEVTFRALASEMGMTPPALYRYVDSVAAVNLMIADRIFVEVVMEMAEAGEPYGDDDPAAQMMAAVTTFRGWALEHKPEFQLVFTTTPLSGDRTARYDAGQLSHPLSRGLTGEARQGAEMFADLFGGIFMRLLHQRPFQVPAPEQLDEEFMAIHNSGGEGRADVTELLGRDALGLIWLFELAWAQLCGVVALEVYGHVRPQLVRSGSVFRAQMLEIGRRAGLSDDWDRLAAVSQEVLARRAERQIALDGVENGESRAHGVR